MAVSGIVEVDRVAKPDPTHEEYLAQQKLARETQARADATAALPDLKVAFAAAEEVEQRCDGDRATAVQARNEAQAKLDAIRRGAVALPFERAAKAYVKAADDLREHGLALDLAVERSDVAKQTAYAFRARLAEAERLARGYDLNTQRLAAQLVERAKVAKVRMTGSPDADLVVAIATGQPVPLGTSARAVVGRASESVESAVIRRDVFTH